MTDTTEIEKKSLEAHVELCAERYRFIEEKLDNLDKRISTVSASINDVYNAVRVLSETRNNQLISWGLGIIGVLFGCVGYLVVHYVIQ
jgi:hypothetical protein